MAIYFLHALLISLLVYLLYKQYEGSPLKVFFFPVLLLKLGAGAALGMIYTYYYTYGGDTFRFHQEAALVANWARQSPQHYLDFLLYTTLPDSSIAAQLTLLSQPRALVMVKLLSLLYLLTHNSYWLSGAYLSLFSFWGMWALSNTLVQLFPRSKWAALAGFLFFPSVVFWSSGVLKETVAVGMIGLTCSFVLRQKFSAGATVPKRVLLGGFFVSVGLIILWQLKFYYCAVLVACLIAYLLTDALVRSLEVKNKLRQWLLWEGIFGAMILIASRHPTLGLEAILTATVQNHNAHLAGEIADAALVYNTLQPTLMSFLLHAPKALVGGLFRPFAWEADGFLQAWVGFENFVLLLATGLALFRLLKSKATVVEKYFLLLISTAQYILILAVLLSLAAPNFGEISRYKVAFLPFFIYLIGLGVTPAKNRTMR